MLHWLVLCFLVWGTVEGVGTVRRTQDLYLSLDQFSYTNSLARETPLTTFPYYCLAQGHGPT